VFTEVFQQVFTDVLSWTFTNHHYDDFRKFCLGAKQISGTAGITWTDRSLFQDLERDFSAVKAGANLNMVTATNHGDYRVVEVLAFPVGAERIPVAYTTSSGLLGTLIVGDYGEVTFDSPIRPDLPEGEVLTLTSGSNAGSYRLQEYVGEIVGPVGDPHGLEILSTDTNNPVKITTVKPHRLVDGQGIAIMGNTDPGLNGLRSVNSIISSTEFTVNHPGIGGIDGKVLVYCAKAKVAMGLLRLDKRMTEAATGQSYTVVVDRLGVRTPQVVTGEDVSSYFYL
jgi:hypothetical protein